MTERATSELEHLDPASIHSLLPTEARSDTARSSLEREGEARIAAADVIFAQDTDTGTVDFAAALVVRGEWAGARPITVAGPRRAGFDPVF